MHRLEDHLVSVADLAAEFVRVFSDPRWGELAGRWHDLGKYSATFQQMIAAANGFEAHIEDVATGPRDHSTAGAVHAVSALRAGGMPLAFVIAGHHGGLPDRSGLAERLQAKQALLDAALGGSPPKALLACEPPRSDFLVKASSKDRARRIEFWTRMLFSALCDADFLDTEAFYDASRAETRQVLRPSLRELKEKLDAHMATLAQNASTTAVNRVRAEILGACRDAAAARPGVFSLTVPTGGGKTLASMAFAFDHALANDLRRVVVAIPFTSIIEQSAAVYREALGADAVIEHHSALDPERESPQNRIASENWDAPVIVTTTVQLLESLFANRPSTCRKLHNLARSIIVLDEAQTLPPGLLTPILDALWTLVDDYSVTILICTATQPALGRTDELPGGLPAIREIVPAELRAFDRLRRVRVHWPVDETPTAYPALATEVARHDRALAIVHKRRDARELCGFLNTLRPPGEIVHLSALMCAAHRTEVLADVKARLFARRPLILVATQLVEAGVDIDFPVVYRALAGLDSLAQAAGRCNREGTLETLGELRVFLAPTAPPRGVPQTAMSVARGMLRTAVAEGLGLDIGAPDAFATYFAQLYGARDLDAQGIQELRAELRFPDVAHAFKLIEDDWSAAVVVPWGDAERRLHELEREGPSRERLRSLQRFTVTVPRREREAWVASGRAREIADAVVALAPGCDAYDNRFGLQFDRIGITDPSSLIA